MSRTSSPLLPWLASDAPRATLLIRIAVGVVFFSEGIQKFLYPAALGAGRFAKIGIPAPEVMGPFVGCVEIVCGALVLAGLATRLAAIPLIVDMIVAIASTKVPILLGHGYLGFAAPSVAKHGCGACCTRRGQISRCSSARASSCSSARAIARSTPSSTAGRPARADGSLAPHLIGPLVRWSSRCTVAA